MLEGPTAGGAHAWAPYLFAVVISLRYLIRDDEFKSFKRSLSQLIKQVLRNCSHLTEPQLLNEMGFPANWNKIMRYKK